MKINLSKRIIAGFGALALMFALNLRHAFNNYGITTNNKLHIEILAQSNSSGGGSGSSSDSGSNNNYGGSSSDSGSGSSNPWYEWPFQGTTKDEYYKEEPCSWSWEINLGIIKWSESGSGKKRQCYNGGEENCTTGECH